MRRVTDTTAILALAGCALALALVASTPQSGGGDFTLVAKKKRGSIMVSNSIGGEAIVSATGVVPGEVVEGEVMIANKSRRRARLSLSAAGLTDTPGGSGELSDVLQAEITEHKKKRSRKGLKTKTTTLYVGSVGALGDTSLGLWKPRTKRRYEFRIEFPDGGLPSSAVTGDNAYQGSSMSINFVWKARPQSRP